MTQKINGSTTFGRILPRGLVHLSEHPVTVIPPNEDAERPHVRLHREANVVTAIDVICKCGETFRLVCDYQPTPANPAQSSEN